MTPVFLLEELQKFISSKTSDIILPVRTRTGSSEEKERAATVYKMGLPEADDVQQKVPYILLKFLTGTDDKKAGEPGRQLQSKNNICGVFRRWAGRTAGTSQSDFESAQRIEESRDNRRRSICFGTAAGIYRISRHHAAILHGRNGDKLEYASHAT